jgi:uncharacterized membrane protein
VSGKVPLDFDAVDDDLTDEAFKIADMTVTADGGVTKTSSLLMQAENQIDIRSVHADFADDTESLDDGDKFEVRPGDEVTLTIKIKNGFSDSDDVDIDDITVRAFTTGSGDLDVDEDDDVDVRAGESEEVTLVFDVDEDADSGTYDLFITASGVDDNGARHGDTMEVKVKVDRETHEVRIETASLDQRTIKPCEGSNTVTLTVGVLNAGRKNEDDVAIEVSSSALGIEERKDEIELDQDDDARFKFLLSIPPSTKSGTYPIQVSSYYFDDTLSDQRALTLDVTNCETYVPPAATPPSSGTQPAPAPSAPPAAPAAAPPASETPTGAVPVKSRLQAFAESDTYLAMLAGLIAVVALAIILLIVAFARRR